MAQPEIVKSDFVSCSRRIHGSNFGRTNQKDEYKDYAKVSDFKRNNK